MPQPGQVTVGGKPQHAARGEEQLDGGAGRWSDEADGDQAWLIEGVWRHVGLQAATPGVEGSGGNALAFAEVGDSQAALAEAVKALLPAVMSGGVRASAGA